MTKDGIYCIAELSCNHSGLLPKAKRLICEAKKAGADAVKVQYFKPEHMTVDSDDFVIKDGIWAGHKLYDLYSQARTPQEWFPELKDLAESLGLGFIVSIYHPDALDFTEKLGVRTYKISSFELTYDDLIEEVAYTKKALILSTGSADYKEIDRAVNTIRKYHNCFILLKCTSEYPAMAENLNLKTILAMRRSFKCDIGFSDHTAGILAPIVAVSMGAKVIEKHLKVDNDCLDAKFSIMPDMFAMMVKCVHEAYAAIGEISYGGNKQFRRQKIEGRMVRTV